MIMLASTLVYGGYGQPTIIYFTQLKFAAPSLWGDFLGEALQETHKENLKSWLLFLPYGNLLGG